MCEKESSALGQLLLFDEAKHGEGSTSPFATSHNDKFTSPSEKIGKTPNHSSAANRLFDIPLLLNVRLVI